MLTKFLISDKTKQHGNRYQLAANIAKYLPETEIIELKDADAEGIQVNFEEPQLLGNGRRDIHYFSFEGTRAPQHFVEALNDYTLLLVPSLHTKQMWINSGVKKPVEIVPHGFDPEVFSPEPVTDRQFTFGFNGGWIQNPSDRKGLIYLLRAWCKLNLTDVKLRIHLNNSALWPNYDFEAGLRAHGIRNLKNVIVDSRDLAYDQLASEFYNKIDVLVNPSRAEGFSLPTLEAMACGKLCIVTGWGGHTEFCDYPNFWINYELEDAPTFWYPQMYQNSRWATPSVKILEQLLQYCNDNQDEIRKKGLKNAEKVKDYGYPSIAKRFEQTIHGYL